MRFVKYFTAFWAALIFYAIASLISGAMGISAYEEYEAEYQKQNENIEVLRRLNSELRGEKEALNSDSDTLEREAIEIGYGRNGEHYIIIQGFHEHQKKQLKSGDIYLPKEANTLDDEVIKMYALVIFIILTLGIAAFDILRFIRRS